MVLKQTTFRWGRQEGKILYLVRGEQIYLKLLQPDPSIYRAEKVIIKAICSREGIERSGHSFFNIMTALHAERPEDYDLYLVEDLDDFRPVAMSRSEAAFRNVDQRRLPGIPPDVAETFGLPTE